MWFLLDSVKQKIEKALSSGMQFSAEERDQIELKSKDFGKLQIVGRSAVIPIEGVLTEKRDFYAAFFGGGNTTYPDIIASIQEAENSSDIDEIVYMINSPGGGVNGLFAAMDAIQGASKPSRAIVRNMATSAGYGLASQADQVIASNRASQLGSVGVAYDTYVFDGNIKEVSISSTEAPEKRPDLLTEEGQGVIREQLDDIHNLFVESIASGRKTTVKNVNKTFGRGGIVLAREALDKGMIDGIEAENQEEQRTAASGQNTEVRFMDLKTLKAEHPDVYAAAVEIGANEERDRVQAHLTMGEASGDMETAKTAIKDGSAMTASLQATYLAAGMNKSAVEAREEDNPTLETPPKEETTDSEFDAACAKEFEKLTRGVDNE